MAVHIIFRSGGLIISLILGWLISRKRYTITQVTSVLLVTVGVVITTLSAQSSTKKSTSVADPYTYATGIGILTLALVLSGILGLIQDWTYAKYGRPTLAKVEGPAPWQESMFYLHFLALPMFIPLLPDLAAQMHTLNSQGPRVELNFPIPFPASLNLTTAFSDLPPPYSLPNLPIHIFPQSGNMSLLSITESIDLNSTTLTTRVSALTVTLILVVRKATSLIISVIGVSQVVLALKELLGIPDREWSFFGVNLDAVIRTIGTAFVGSGEAKRPQQVDNRMMWMGAMLVLLGTVGYTIGSRPRVAKPNAKGKIE
ncbi:hypothetical protein M413DRAFT_444451 [Hebeloma cylindrosporum]|uniref:Uncharacterized protein n=1 Tax=Hebeloma cylindrosporum TaxID=76867 RepID=A0A0C3CGQ9_HEBCY|nr:hypothetical protein M413DRAFT_444451 [Hebeloma cylindrosporum h7]